MSGAKDTEKAREDGGKARRTYASLKDERGFKLVMPIPSTGETVVRICPMDTPSLWRHVGGGKATSLDALYEKIEDL